MFSRVVRLLTHTSGGAVVPRVRPRGSHSSPLGALATRIKMAEQGYNSRMEMYEGELELNKGNFDEK
ncbi:hypothetical protein Pmani_007226 [Petrolisthes manimaculis]|uniref:Uncharacterized protein n=1 Tax=Petrolisthes manimaculis TaxID=1843537 RepID=A0AAE1Q868_9EUCA|nr:hypothetical protein Pmani_007226 [Petrolisthes manimaculis]